MLLSLDFPSSTNESGPDRDPARVLRRHCPLGPMPVPGFSHGCRTGRRGKGAGAAAGLAGCDIMRKRWGRPWEDLRRRGRLFRLGRGTEHLFGDMARGIAQRRVTLRQMDPQDRLQRFQRIEDAAGRHVTQTGIERGERLGRGVAGIGQGVGLLGGKPRQIGHAADGGAPGDAQIDLAPARLVP